MRDLRIRFCHQIRQSVRLLDRVFYVLALVAPMTQAQDICLADLAYSNADLDFITPRGPSFAVPDDGDIIVAMGPEHFHETFLVEDDRGVLKQIKVTMHRWSSDEHFAQLWHLEDIGLYLPPPMEERKRFLEKHMIRYADKRLSGEIKKAKKGSSLHQVGQVKKAIRPQSRFQLAEDYRLRLQGKVLRGLIQLKLENPHIKIVELEFKAFNKGTFWRRESQVGETTLFLGHHFDRSRRYFSGIEYGLYGADWKWELRRELQEIAPGLFIQFRTEQDNRRLPFSENSGRIGELFYSLNF